jgi:hypothetical protein
MNYDKKGHGAMLSKFPSILIDLTLQTALTPTGTPLALADLDASKKRGIKKK